MLIKASFGPQIKHSMASSARIKIRKLCLKLWGAIVVSANYYCISLPASLPCFHFLQKEPPRRASMNFITEKQKLDSDHINRKLQVKGKYLLQCRSRILDKSNVLSLCTVKNYCHSKHYLIEHQFTSIINKSKIKDKV